jgi:hypothetical protein
MNRQEGLRRLEQIRGQDAAAVRELRALIRDCQAPVAPPTERAWHSAAAEVLAELLCTAAAAALPEGTSTESRERLEAAVALSGPDGLAALTAELDARVAASRQPRAQLALLQMRLRCLDLKLRCLDHLDAIFRAERAQP